MFHPMRSTVLAGAMCVGGAIGFCTTAKAAEPTQQELMEQIKALEAKVQRLQDTQTAASTGPSAREVDATVQTVLRDADQRSQLLQANGFTAGISKGKILIRSDDGKFEINPNFQFQLRYVFNYRDESGATPAAGDAQVQDGFEIRRMRFGFDGHAFSEDFQYKLLWDANQTNGQVSLLDAVVRYHFADNWWVKGGQYKDPTFHEFGGVSSKRQLAAERSLINSVLGGNVTNRIQGVALQWESPDQSMPVRAEIGYTDGPATLNTAFTDGGGVSSVGLSSPDWGAYGRAEYLVMGDWRQYDDFTALGNTKDLLVVGAGAFYGQQGDAEALWHTIDAQAELGPVGLYGAYVGVYSDAGTAGVGSSYDFGWLAQAGYLVNSQWEVFGRWSYINLDTPTTNGQHDFCELTAGVNYYLQGHAAKFTIDATWLPNGAPGANLAGLGILVPDAGDDQITFRAQFQLLL